MANSIFPAYPTAIPVTVSEGGTGLATLTAHALYVGNGTNPPTALAVGATGQVLTGVTGGDPVWASPATSGTVTSVSVVTANGISGSVATATTTPAITLTLGAITPTTVNGNTFTTGSSTYTGTAAAVYTFPATSASIARTDAAQTFTGPQTIASHIASLIYPAADAINAVQIMKADGTTGVFNVDTTNSRISVGTTNPGDTIEVSKLANHGMTLRRITTSAGVGYIHVESFGKITIGADNDIGIYPGNIQAWLFKVTTGHLFANTDNTYDIGASGANRPRSAYFGTSVISPAFRLGATTGTLTFSSTAPTISSGFGTSPSIAANNGTAAFTINVGTGGTAQNGVIGLPTAATGWIVQVRDLTNDATIVVSQTASSTTTATIQAYSRTTGLAVAFTASDILQVTAVAY